MGRRISRVGPGHPGGRDDEGSTLLEVVVGMSIMSVFLAAFTGAVVTLTQTQNRAEALTSSGGDLDTAFQRVDRTVRYASAISVPGTTGPAGAWYVELLSTATGPSVCTQLRVNAGSRTLQSRTWTPNGAAYTDLSPSWRTLAGLITNGTAAVGSATVPFALAATSDTVGFEQLTVRLDASAGNPSVPSQSRVTFTALNSADASDAVRAGTATPTCDQVPRS